MVAAGCGADKQVEDSPGRPIIFFAVDGMEWSVVKPLLERGELPVIAGLMDRGTFGYLRSMTPTYSAVIWTTIATGKLPAMHGIKHFVYESAPGRGDYHYYTSGHRQTKAFWNILSDYKRTVHTLGWWMTYPAEKVNGIMVSQTNTTSVLRAPQRALWKGALFKGVEGQVYPPDYQNRVMGLLEEVDSKIDSITESIFGVPPNPTTPFSQMMWDQTLWAFRADATYLRVAQDILSRGEPFDVLSIYIGGPDVSGHRFWRYAHPEEFSNPPPPDQIENFGNVIDDYYRYIDRSIGDILARAPENVTVIIASDHGMKAINSEGEFKADDPPQLTNSANHLDAPPGVFIAEGSPFRSGAPDGMTSATLDPTRLKVIGGVLDIAPTLLWIEGIPLGRDLAGEPLTELLDPAWVEAHPRQYVDTHDDKAWLASREERIREAVDQNERLEQLRSLGYIK